MDISYFTGVGRTSLNFLGALKILERSIEKQNLTPGLGRIIIFGQGKSVTDDIPAIRLKS